MNHVLFRKPIGKDVKLVNDQMLEISLKSNTVQCFVNF